MAQMERASICRKGRENIRVAHRYQAFGVWLSRKRRDVVVRKRSRKCARMTTSRRKGHPALLRGTNQKHTSHPQHHREERLPVFPSKWKEPSSI